MSESGRHTPQVTVLMPVRNGAAYLGDSINSVLAQSFADFELLVIDDGSSDETPEVLAGITDSRLKVVRQEGAGIVAALNRGLELIDSEYIARFDADDVMRPDRLERQVDYLQTHHDVIACGTQYRTFGELETIVRPPRTPARCRARQFFWPALGHPTSMLRRSALTEHNIRYRENYPHAEDYKLFSELAAVGDLAGLNFVGIDYRIHPGSVSVSQRTIQQQTATRVATENIRAAGISISPEKTHRLLWSEWHGVTGAVNYLVRHAPRKVLIAARAEGLAGVAEALQVIRERVNSIIRL